MLEKIFHLKKNNTNVLTEITAGLTSYLAMAYILAVNPIVMSGSGMEIQSVFNATALATGVCSILLGLIANWPTALSSGLGFNALFVYTVVVSYGYSYKAALAAMFVEGVIFVVICLLGIQNKIINIIPKQLKTIFGIGIGFFICFLGLKNAGIIVPDASTGVTLGNLHEPAVVLAVLGIFITIILLVAKFKNPVFFGIIITVVFGLIFRLVGFVGEGLPSFPTQFISFDLKFVHFNDCFVGMSELFSRPQFFVVLISMFFTDFFNPIGKLSALAGRCGKEREDGTIENIGKAMLVDGLGTVLGGLFGAGNMTCFLESSAGAEAGGRTGLTSCTTGLLFLLSMIVYPFVGSLITSCVTTPALVLVGVMMSSGLKDIDWKNDLVYAISGFLTIIFMVLTYSISDGMAVGFISYSVAMLGSGKGKDVNFIIWILDLVFIFFFVTR